MAEILRTLTTAELDQVSGGGAVAADDYCGNGYHIVGPGPRPIADLATVTQKLAVNAALTAAAA